MDGKRLQRHIDGSIALAAVNAGAIFFVPLVKSDGTAAQRWGLYVVAALFWAGLIGQMVNIRLTTRARKRLQEKRLQSCRFDSVPVGVLAFRQNVEGLLADGLLAAVIVLFVVGSICRVRGAWFTIVLVGAALFLFQLHCIFNGRNYRALKVYQFKNKGAKEK